MKQCGDCNRVLDEGDDVYELRESGSVRVCEDCFENYMDKWGVKGKRRKEVKEQAKI